MKKIFSLLGLLWLSFTIQSKSDPRPLAKPNKPLSLITNFFSTAQDFIILESLGVAALSPENELFIRKIIDNLEMQDYCIELRSMSNYAQQGFSLTDIFTAPANPITLRGRVNIFSLPSLFGRKSHTHIYISEEWFSTLHEQEKQALIRQELMQLKHGLHLKRLGIAIASVVGCFLLEGEIKRHLVDPRDSSEEAQNHNKIISFFSSKVRDLTILLIVAAYSRIGQKKADTESIKTIDDKEGFISLLKTMQNQTEDYDSHFSFKRFINALVNPFRALVRFKPSFDERIEYIYKLKV